MPPAARVVDGKLILRAGRSKPISYSLQWLYDHDPKYIHPVSNQKLRPASQIPTFLSLSDVKEDGDKLRLQWTMRGEESVYAKTRLLPKTTTNSNARFGLAGEKYWKPSKKEDGVLRKWSVEESTAQKVLTNLAVYGVHLVTGMKGDVETTERFVREHLGPPRETFYGRMWDTAPRKLEDVNDTAYTYDALDPHTDTCYLFDSPGLQVFNCVAQDSGDGGQTRLVDGFQVLYSLRKTNPETFKFFAETQLVFQHVEKGLFTRVAAPVISMEPDGKTIKQVRFNEYDLSPLDYMDDETVDKFYQHIRVLHAAFDAGVRLIKLNEGDLIVVDNHRVLHGRNAFKGYRNLIGCYVGADDWIMRARAVELGK